MEGRVTIQIQDASPVDVEAYYAHLFAGIDDFRGLMLATFVLDNTGMDSAGGYIPIEWDPYDTANRVVKSVRANVARRLAGEPTLVQPEEAARVTIPVDKKAAATPAEEVRLTEQQAAALKRVRACLVELDQKGVKPAVQAALEAGLRPFDIIIQGMAQGMEEVGKLYEQGDYYLPELVMAGATMKEGMTVLQPILAGEGGAGALSKGKIVLGTVQGDMHDIGKNLVRTMLEGAGFQVVDLGVDVTPQKFVEAAQRESAQIIALSALLTTTLKGMKLTVEALHATGLRDRVRVMIGGAPVSSEYARQIGADGYAATAVGAVREAERLLGLK
jgi:5-methyltetrahydrofolate--homocysteine methyltransferase